MRCLKKQHPDAEVHYFTKPAFKTVLEHNPYIDHLHLLDKPLLQKTMELKQLGFDYIIDLHNNLRTRIIKGIMDVPAFSFDKLNTEKGFLVKLKENMLPPIHIVDRYLQTLSSFDITNDGAGLDYFLPPNIQLDKPEKYIAFAIGAQHATKRLPADRIIAVCKNISLPVILLGGKEDAATGAEIAAQCGSHVSNYCGSLSLHQSAYMVKHAHKVITHDTGLMHIAAAFKKEILSVWGNTVPEFGMTPYYGEHPVQQQQFEVALSCRPCSKIGFETCPLKHFNCMQLQDTQAISTEASA